MNRKQFIESQGATCKNWTWSWSFINEKEKIIIFGEWDNLTDGSMTLILSDEWEYTNNNHKKPGYSQSLKHIRLIENEGYKLKTFKIIYSDEKRGKNNAGPAVIKEFVPELTSRALIKVGSRWYASDGHISNLLPEEVDTPEKYFEGSSKTVSVNIYERDRRAREECVERHGYKCAVCSFDFKEVYGEIGEKYIHVHHIIPLAEIKNEYQLDPVNDLIPVCPNCHAIIHRTRPVLTIEQLKKHIEKNNKST